MCVKPQIPDPDRQHACVAAFLADDPRGAESLHNLIRPAIVVAVETFFGSDGNENDDIAQETILAVFAYIRKCGGFRGNLESFAVTVAKNRCRDILRTQQRFPHQSIEPFGEWLADSRKSNLDELADAEFWSLVLETLAALDKQCRKLLEALYFDEETVVRVRQRFGLKSVQLVYYRRDVCLRKVLKKLKIRLARRSSGR